MYLILNLVSDYGERELVRLHERLSGQKCLLFLFVMSSVVKRGWTNSTGGEGVERNASSIN